jgi:stage II sporulation protein D
VSVDATSYLVRGDSIRWVLRTPEDRILNSALLLDIREQITAGRISALTVHGGGWGHGIGMCQIGAMGRAAAGHSYRDILAAYYTGATLMRIH